MGGDRKENSFITEHGADFNVDQAFENTETALEIASPQQRALEKQAGTESEILEVRNELGVEAEVKQDILEHDQEIAVQYLIDHPEELPKRIKDAVRMEVIQDLIRDDANESSLQISSEIESAEKANPVQKFVTKILVESWLLSHGYRMVEDKSISASSRQLESQQNKIKSQGFFKKLAAAFAGFDEKTRTELDEQLEILALHNQSLKTENNALESKNAALIEKIDHMMSGANERAEKMLSEAKWEANQIIIIAKKDASVTQQEVASKLQDFKKEIEDTKAAFAVKKVILERQLSELQLEITKKQEIKAQLDANPQIFDAFERQYEVDRERLEKLIDSGIDAIADRWPEILSEEKDVGPVLKDFTYVLLDFRDLILDPLAKYEDKFGNEKRSNLVHSIIPKLNSLFRDYEKDLELGTVKKGSGVVLVPTKAAKSLPQERVKVKLSIDAVFKYLAALSSKEASSQTILNNYNRVVGPLISDLQKYSESPYSFAQEQIIYEKIHDTFNHKIEI